MTEKIFAQISSMAQVCVQQSPVIVLGSGASVPHQIRGMDSLSSYLLKNIVPEGSEEEDAWLLVRNALNQGDGLEEALLRIPAPRSLVSKIVKLTWKAIASDDFALLARASSGSEHFPLSELLRKLFDSVNRRIDIVTPNYDRVAEYACDIAGYVHFTGFLPGIIRQRNNAEPFAIRCGANQLRIVRIWKVHGSLDWFESANGTVLSLPPSEELPESFAPLIVTPGVSKYERTHDEPFRSVIQGADKVLAEAKSFLCIGYGFRDRHIQPKLIERCRQGNVLIVILARALTAEAKDFLLKCAGSRYLALEEQQGGTRIFSPQHPSGVVLDTPNLWTFDGFNQMVL